MSKKQKKVLGIGLGWETLSDSTKVILSLALLLCVVTLFAILKLQGDLDHQALQQRIDILKDLSNRK